MIKQLCFLRPSANKGQPREKKKEGILNDLRDAKNALLQISDKHPTSHTPKNYALPFNYKSFQILRWINSQNIKVDIELYR